MRKICVHLRTVFSSGEIRLKNGRGGEIRTHDLLYPKQARYQATLRPDPRAGEGAYLSIELQPRIFHARIGYLITFTEIGGWKTP